MSSKNTRIAFGLSKMSIEDVNQIEEYEQIKFVEFLEMIGRVAHLFYLDTPMDKAWSLEQKCFHIIDGVLKYGEMSAEHPVKDIQTESESDNDY